METLLFYDTETTGLPIWDKPSGDEDQPHICQLAAILTDSTGNHLSAMNMLIKPHEWEISDELAAFHGITTEKALAGGVDVHTALSMFFALWRQSSMRVGFNESFDARMIRIAIKRHIKEDDFADEWKDGEKYCAMQKSRMICNISNAKGTGTKPPKLTEAYHHFTGSTHTDAHDAMADVLATIDVYFGIMASGQPS